MDLYLNEPLDEDLRGIDELLEAADNLEAEPIQPNQPQEKIIDEGFFFEMKVSMGKFLISRLHMTMAFMLKFSFLRTRLILMRLVRKNSWIRIRMIYIHLRMKNMHVGFVKLVVPAADPVFSSLYNSSGFPISKPNSNVVRVWAKFLPPGNFC